MASQRIRSRKDGSKYIQVLYRHNGAQTSMSFEDTDPGHRAATRFKNHVERFGPDEAERILGIERTQAEEPTLTEWCNRHIDELTGVEEGTKVSYRRYVRNDVAPTIGELPISAVAESTISEWVQKLQSRTELAVDKAGKPILDENGRPKRRTIRNSGKTIANKHGFLSGVFKSAMRAGLVTSNPCEHTRLPRTDDGDEPTFLSRDAFAGLLADVPGEWRPLTLWLVATGTRFGEATALTVGDINQADRTCRISKAWKYTGTAERRLSYPKSKKSRRTINLPQQALDVLDLERPADAILFPDPVRPGHITYSRFRHAGWKTAAAKLDPRPTPHDLRHTCASWMIQAGIPLPVVQAHLGHESISTTIGVYGHIDRASAARAADAIGAMLG